MWAPDATRPCTLATVPSQSQLAGGGQGLLGRNRYLHQPIWAQPESGQPSQTRSRTFLKRRIPAEEKKEQETSSELFWDPPDSSSKVPTDSGVGSSANSGATSNLTLGVCEEAFVTMQASESLSPEHKAPKERVSGV